MNYTDLVHDAVEFAIQTHWIDQHQFRKGKDIPYIIHPLAVGMILARAGCDDEIVAAGILHDTIEESPEQHPVNLANLEVRFGERVARIVDSVTIPDEGRPWLEKKSESIERVASYDHGSVLVRSADLIANERELQYDLDHGGPEVWDRFNAPKETRVLYQLKMIDALLERWPENPLAHDLIERKATIFRNTPISHDQELQTRVSRQSSDDGG